MFLKGKITTASMPDDETITDITERFEKRYDANIDFTVEINSSIIGGIIVAVRDDVYDGSVRGRLSSMREQIIK